MFISKQFLNISHATHKSSTHTHTLDLAMEPFVCAAAVALRIRRMARSNQNTTQIITCNMFEAHGANRMQPPQGVTVLFEFPLAVSVVWKLSQPTVLKVLAALQEQPLKRV